MKAIFSLVSIRMAAVGFMKVLSPHSVPPKSICLASITVHGMEMIDTACTEDEKVWLYHVGLCRRHHYCFAPIQRQQTCHAMRVLIQVYIMAVRLSRRLIGSSRKGRDSTTSPSMVER